MVIFWAMCTNPNMHVRTSLHCHEVSLNETSCTPASENIYPKEPPRVVLSHQSAEYHLSAEHYQDPAWHHERRSAGRISVVSVYTDPNQVSPDLLRCSALSIIQTQMIDSCTFPLPILSDSSVAIILVSNVELILAFHNSIRLASKSLVIKKKKKL